MAGDCRRFVTRGRGNGGPGGRHLHTVPVAITAVTHWLRPIRRRAVAIATARQCIKVMGLFGAIIGGRLGGHQGKMEGLAQMPRHIYSIGFAAFSMRF